MKIINPEDLEEALENIGNTHDRLEGDPEWSHSKGNWTFKSQIVGAFAQWACRQSPYGVPEGLENVCKYLNASLESQADWKKMEGMVEVSLCDISRWLQEILMDQGIVQFDSWNRCKVGSTPDMKLVSAYSNEKNPDNDFIDLHALLRNVCITIRDERRQNKAFDDAFELEYGKL